MAIMTVNNRIATLHPGSAGSEGNAFLAVGGPEDSIRFDERTDKVFAMVSGSKIDRLSGSGFTYDSWGELTGGVVTGWDLLSVPAGGNPSALRFSITDLAIPATALGDLLHNTELNRAPLVFAGDDIITGALFGGDWSERLFGYGGDDTISAAPRTRHPATARTICAAARETTASSAAAASTTSMATRGTTLSTAAPATTGRWAARMRICQQADLPRVA